MRLNLRNLVLSSAALWATAAFAADHARLEVPFNFVVKNHAYHAGPYNVEIDSGRSSVRLSSVKEPTAQPLMWIVGPGVSDSYHPKVSLTFDVIGSDHVLRQIQYGTLITPNLNARPKHRVDETKIIGE
jgi:hypothetical protein